LPAKTRPPQTTAVAVPVGFAAGDGFASVRPTSVHDSPTAATARSHATRIAIAGWSHFATKAPRPLDLGRAWPEVEFAGDPSNEPQRPAGEKPTVRVGRARGGRRQCETRKRPSVRAHRRECATRQSCTREHHATVEAAPLRAASPSRPGLGVERRRPLLQPSIFVTAAAALSRSPSLRRTPCRSRRRKGSFTRPGVIPSAIAPVRCEEETRPVSSAAPASISSGDIRASLL
jgi:hypothetical protein